MLLKREIKTQVLTSRQRVINAIEHKPVDRVPIDLGMHYSTGISAFAYKNLREYLGLDTDKIEMVDMVQCLARVDDDILQRFHCDTILLHPGWEKTKSWQPKKGFDFIIPESSNPILQADGSYKMSYKGENLIMPKGGFFFDGGWPDFHNAPLEYTLDRTAKEAERIFKETDYFTTYMQFGAFFGEIDWLCKMMTDPDEVKEANKKMLAENKENAKAVIDRMGHYIQAIALNSDLGTQNAPWINPDVYEDVVAPFLKEFCRYIKEQSGLKIFLHSCGSIKDMIPILIDCGIDIINPVQISANNMQPEALKNIYGDNIAFWGGGCDTQNVLNNGTPSEVSENVKYLMKIFKQNSGFVFNQVHNIMGDIKPGNIVAMYDTAYKESFYN
jgi:uroporphyrinogen decarboxylase